MDDLKIVKGNEFATLIKVRAFKYDGTEVQDFNFKNATNLRIAAHIDSKTRIINESDYQVLDDNMLKINWTNHETLGEYMLEASGEYEGSKWRFFDKTPIFTIVNTNAEANIPQMSIIDEDYYRIIHNDIKLWSASYNNKIDYIGEDQYVYKWDPSVNNYVKTDIYVKGDSGEGGSSSRIHVGEFNSGNDCDEEGWYDSIVYGRPECSESDEKYVMYTSSNGTQMCWSKRNSGKSYHRLGKNHPWVALTHDDYGRSEANASALKVYPVSGQEVFTFSEQNLQPASGICREIYSGDDLNIGSFNMTALVTLNPDDIVEVNCFYRRGNSGEAFNNYKYDSDAYIYISDTINRDHSAAHLKSDFIKVKSLGSLDQDITHGEYLNLDTANLILSTNCGRHFVKYTGTKSGTFFIHFAGDFTTRSSWVVIYTPGCKIHHAQSINNIS